MNGYLNLSPAVREILGRTSPQQHVTMTQDVRFLAALTAKSERTGSPVYAGIPAAERSRRRAAGRVAKASRRANRVR